MNHSNWQNYDRPAYCRNCQRYPYTAGQESWNNAPWYQPMPYYMAHSYPLSMQGDEEDERDLEKLKSLFPKTAQLIQPLVEEECDRMEYDGSLMFDEYPDRLTTEKLVEKIYQKVQASNEEQENETDDVFATQCRNCNGNRFGDGIGDLISVMLFEEMHRRRCRHRRCKRWW